MRILLTGSSGWLGRHLAPLLRSRGHEVVGLDVAPGAQTDIIASVADREAVFGAVGSNDVAAIIHCGGLHKPDIVRFPPQAFIDTNVTGTLNLLEAAAQAKHQKFVFTSTTSLMVRSDVRAGAGSEGAWWMDEEFAPLSPRNVYGATKLAAEGLCRVVARDTRMSVAILRTGRFFPEADDMLDELSGENLKANEFLNRRLSVADCAEAHVAALDRIEGCETFVISAPPPFERGDAAMLAQEARSVIAARFPDAEDLYRQKGWALPEYIERVYDPAKAQHLLGWRARTDFAAILEALRADGPLPFADDPGFVSPILSRLA